MDIEQLIRTIPKAELHIHIEGSLEPELMFEIAQRNGVSLRYRSVEELRRAYDFTDLQSFLDIYYEGAHVLRKERDFHDMTAAYLRRAQADSVTHAEIFFDPQTHTDRGIEFATVIAGIGSALQESPITTKLILCFLRHLSADSAMRTLERALPYRIASLPLAWTPRKSAIPRRNSLRFSIAHARRDSEPWLTPGRRALRATFAKRSICCMSRESITACVASRIRPSSRSSQRRRFRSPSAHYRT